jgi:uncharacterized protein
MKIVLIGATGNVGSRILREALERGHAVTAIARHLEKLEAHPNLRAVRGDIADEAGLTPLLAGHDAIVSALKFDGLPAETLLRAVRNSAVPRFLVVGGAGSLQVASGNDLVDTPNFPPAYRAEALAAREFLRRLRVQTDLNWTLLSPSALLVPGRRTGRFRLGHDQLLVDASGHSTISMEDLAQAMIDEFETPRHPRQRFTVGY